MIPGEIRSYEGEGADSPQTTLTKVGGNQYEQRTEPCTSDRVSIRPGVKGWAQDPKDVTEETRSASGYTDCTELSLNRSHLAVIGLSGVSTHFNYSLFHNFITLTNYL